MCELMALAFARPVSAESAIRAFVASGEENPDGWGLAWYPDRAVALVKEPIKLGQSEFARFLEGYPEVRSPLYIAHVRHKTTGGAPTFADTHPFVRERDGHEYTFAHNGTLRLPDLGDPTDRYRPLGATDSERAFCRILAELDRRGGHLVGPADWEWFHGLLSDLNSHGKLNMLLSDGARLFAYHDLGAWKGLADAGGRPAPTPEKFYPADDEAGLNLALEKILESVNDEFGGHICDESCETVGCPDGGVCVRHECVRNPCEGFDCGADGFCYTDGTSPGVCRKACLGACPDGSRCSMGTCAPDPCGNVCLPGTFCNGGAHRCEPDPQCMAPQAPTCDAPAQCLGGRCSVDPCLFVRCPPGSACVAWDGSCAATADTIAQTDRMARGCAALPGTAAGPGALLMLALSLLGLRRRRPT